MLIVVLVSRLKFYGSNVFAHYYQVPHYIFVIHGHKGDRGLFNRHQNLVMAFVFKRKDEGAMKIIGL